MNFEELDDIDPDQIAFEAQFKKRRLESNNENQRTDQLPSSVPISSQSPKRGTIQKQIKLQNGQFSLITPFKPTLMEKLSPLR